MCENSMVLLESRKLIPLAVYLLNKHNTVYDGVEIVLCAIMSHGRKWKSKMAPRTGYYFSFKCAEAVLCIFRRLCDMQYGSAVLLTVRWLEITDKKFAFDGAAPKLA